MSDETTTEMLAEIDRDLVEIETAVAELAREALQANYPQQIDTTTEMLAETEGQADYTPPDGWRVVQVGEVLQEEDWIIDARDGNGSPTRKAGSKVGEHQVGEHQLYIRRIEPQPQPEKTITPDEVAAQQLIRGLVLQVAAAIEQQETAERPQPVQVSEGRWRTRGGEALAGAINEWPSVQIVRREVEKLQEELGQAKRRVVELETLVADLRTINEAAEKAVISAGRENTDLQHRLDVVSAEWAEQAATCNKLRQHVEAVKAELLQVSHDRYQLQIELDAAQQVPTITEDRFEQGWDAGTAQAVEAIAEWLEPLRKGNTTLRAAVLFHLPHIMRSLTGLTPED